MLVHFHGVKYKECYEELFKGLAIDSNVKARKVTLGQYFVLSFDFASLNRSSNMMVAESALNDMMNNAIKQFYSTYMPWLGNTNGLLIYLWVVIWLLFTSWCLLIIYHILYSYTLFI